MHSSCNFYHAHCWVAFTDFPPKQLEFLALFQMPSITGSLPSLGFCAFLLLMGCSREGVGVHMHTPIYSRARTNSFAVVVLSSQIANCLVSAYVALNILCISSSQVSHYRSKLSGIGKVMVKVIDQD
jgi:hypothetical protein